MKRSIERMIALALVAVAIAIAGCAGTPDAPRAVGEDAGSAPGPQPAVEAGRGDGPTVSPGAAQHFEAALALLRRGRLDDAAIAFEAMTVAYPDLAGPWLNLAIVRARDGRTDEAERALRAAIERNPRNPVAHDLLGQLYRGQGRFEEARDAYQSALRIDPDYAAAHLNLAILLDLYLQQLPQALAHYERYRRLGGDDRALVERWIADLRQRLAASGPADAVMHRNAPGEGP